MDLLWAPWRLAYVAAAPKKPDACFACAALSATQDRDNLLLWRCPPSVVMLNRFPYNNGHLLIFPLRHVGQLAELTSDELAHGLETVRTMVRLLDELMHPDGYNIGINLGAAAGAGLPGHLHWHIVPRWTGDTNFMPVLSETKVIVQALETLYDLLHQRIVKQP